MNTKLKFPKILIGLMAVISIVSESCGQGTFQNLGFESAVLPSVPPGQPGYVPIALGIPGWFGYLGTNQITQVLHNSLTLGSPNISILGPVGGGSGGLIIEGRYTVTLQASDGLLPGANPVDASLTQIGMVPSDANSLQVKINASYPNPSSYFGVSFAGQTLSLTPIGIGSNYTLYGCDISPFAGQAGELRLTALAVPNNDATTIYFDSVAFLITPVPEPSTWALLALGSAASWCLARRRRT